VPILFIKVWRVENGIKVIIRGGIDMIRKIISWFIGLFKKQSPITYIEKRSYKSQALRDWEKKRKRLYKKLKYS
jgi:hypothetical protein